MSSIIYKLTYCEEKEKVFEDYKKLKQFILDKDIYGIVFIYNKEEYNNFLKGGDYIELPAIKDSWRVWRHPVTNKFCEG